MPLDSRRHFTGIYWIVATGSSCATAICSLGPRSNRFTTVIVLCLFWAGTASQAQTVSRNAVQTIFQQGVPHTNKNGKVLTAYDSQKSFLQIAMWGAPPDGIDFDYDYEWQSLKSAGFNTVWSWSRPLADAL